MSAITQRVSNYLGGVSRQSDDKKLPNQVRECLNGYPDPTFGLTKRPGFKWIKNLGTGTTYDSSKWFYIHRDNDERYIGCIKPKPNSGNGDIDIWNAATGAVCTVNYGTGAQAYLTGARANYDILTVQDTSIITNNLVQVDALNPPNYIANSRATLVLSDTPIGDFNVTINGTAAATVTGGASSTYDTLLAALKTSIDNLSTANSLGLTVTKYSTSLEITRASSFTITCSGGSANTKLNVLQDQVDNVGQLPFQSTHGRIVKIINSEVASDTYFAKFTAEDGSSGRGYWAETVDPTKSQGLDQSTMPHELKNTATDQFTFQKITWTARLVGDDLTNSHPSFVGQKIEQAFFYNNRLGFLSKDNVSMSQSQDFYNFYHITAQTVTDSDPVDISCSAIRPAALHGIIPTTQGLLLFSKSQQFLMSSADGVLTPSSSNIRTISNYEMDTAVDPVDMGTNVNFLSKTPAYTRIFGMVTRGQEENPVVLDVGRVVNEWVPATIDTFLASPQNQFLVMSSQSDKKVYFYRTYSDGKENLVEAWFNWELMGTVQTLAVDQDDMFAVTKQGNQFTLSVASLSQSPSDAIIVNNDGSRINPCMDLYTEASNGQTGGSLKKVEFDSTNRFSKCYIPWNNVTGLTPVIIVKGTTATGQFTESGFTTTPTVVTNDGSYPYFKVEGKDLSSVQNDVIVGWKYDLDIILPKTYVRTDKEQKLTDYTASLTVARMKFAVGLSGVMGFKLKSTGTRQGKKEYTADGTTTVYQWDQSDLKYIDDDQIKVRINNVLSTDYTVDTTGTLPKITLNAASSELKTLSGDGSTKTFALTFIPASIPKMKVKIGGVETTDFTINGEADLNHYIHFTNAPASGTNNILVYSADDIVIYLDEWYKLNPTQIADTYLANDIALSDQSVFTIPIHQKTENFQLKVFNDSPFPVSLNSMMWEGNYSPRFYKRF